jgi:hypothetical protein
MCTLGRSRTLLKVSLRSIVPIGVIKITKVMFNVAFKSIMPAGVRQRIKVMINMSFKSLSATEPLCKKCVQMKLAGVSTQKDMLLTPLSPLFLERS